MYRLYLFKMETKHDITTLEDIQLMVDTFYGTIQQDDLIGPIFNEKIQNRWPEHLERMYRFWQTILLEVHTYSGSPFPPHKQLPVSKDHFNRWITLFNSTIDAHFHGPTAEEAKLRAEKMAEMFLYKIEYFRNNS